MNRRTLLALSAIAVGAFATLSHPVSAGEKPFDAAGFAAAQAAGGPILIEVAADWCPTCKAQKPIIDGLSAKPEYKNLTVFRVDFDKQKDVVRDFKATTQSTLIAFKGKTETARSAGDTKAASIEALVMSALK
jgi:thioredoxin 1